MRGLEGLRELWNQLRPRSGSSGPLVTMVSADASWVPRKNVVANERRRECIESLILRFRQSGVSGRSKCTTHSSAGPDRGEGQSRQVGADEQKSGGRSVCETFRAVVKANVEAGLSLQMKVGFVNVR
jgi:hypothetical protein